MELPTADNSWTDSTQEHNPELFQKASHILETNLYCTLSTASPDGEPWVSPVFLPLIGSGIFIGVQPLHLNTHKTLSKIKER